MPFKYFILDDQLNKTNGEILREKFQTVVDDQFLNAPNIFTISEQTAIGSNNYEDTQVRINRGINVYTGRNMGDDWRLLIFNNPNHSIILGRKFFFDNNYWLTFNSETYNNIAVSCMIKRCNNVLRWLDLNGVLHTEPCIFDTLIARTRDQMSADDLINVQGYINVYAQLNSQTKHIKENQRFLVGNAENRVAYKIFGSGVRNFINDITYDDNSAAMVMYTLGGSNVNNSTDDIVNGIANAFQLAFSLSGLPASISGKSNTTFQLQPQLYREQTPIEGRTFLYVSSNPLVASVNANGLVQLSTPGIANITVMFSENHDVKQIIPLEVSNTSIVATVIITPEPGYILEGQTQSYGCQLYIGGTLTPTDFDFILSANNSAPAGSFTIVNVDSNTFTVTNNKRSAYNDLKINCVSGSYTREISINLRGWF